jgi:hypothetical protein
MDLRDAVGVEESRPRSIDQVPSLGVPQKEGLKGAPQQQTSLSWRKVDPAQPIVSTGWRDHNNPKTWVQKVDQRHRTFLVKKNSDTTLIQPVPSYSSFNLPWHFCFCSWLCGLIRLASDGFSAGAISLARRLSRLILDQEPKRS